MLAAATCKGPPSYPMLEHLQVWDASAWWPNARQLLNDMNMTFGGSHVNREETIFISFHGSGSIFTKQVTNTFKVAHGCCPMEWSSLFFILEFEVEMFFCTTASCWLPPFLGMFKANFESVVFKEIEAAGMGAVIVIMFLKTKLNRPVQLRNKPLTGPIKTDDSTVKITGANYKNREPNFF